MFRFLKNKENLVALVIITLGVLISLQIVFKFNLPKLTTIENIFSILGSLTILVALVTYYYQKNRDINGAVINQISFFRKEVLPLNNEFIKKVRLNIPNHIFSRVQLHEPTIKFTKNKYPLESSGQIDLINKWRTVPEQTDVLNALTELALKIKYLGAIDHSALNSIKAPFVELVEMNAVVLLMQREVYTGGDTYGAILELYEKWKDQVDRRPLDERMAEAGKLT